MLVAAAAWVVLRGASMQLGGGPSLPWGETLDATLAWTFGLPTSRVPVALGLGAWAATVVAGLVQQARGARDRDAWILYAGVVLAAPLLSVVAAREGFFYPRYLLLPAAFSLLLAARLLAGLAARGRGGTALAAGLALLFVAGNARHAVAFAERGRAGTRAAMTVLATRTPGDGPVRFAAQWPTWAQLALRYHAGLFAGRGVELRGPRALERRGSADLDWLVLQAAGPVPPDPPAVQPLKGTRFALRHAFDCYGPSCVHWLLYAREAP